MYITSNLRGISVFNPKRTIIPWGKLKPLERLIEASNNPSNTISHNTLIIAREIISYKRMTILNYSPQSTFKYNTTASAKIIDRLSNNTLDWLIDEWS